jgi:plasmid stabilization system protein ParE
VDRLRFFPFSGSVVEEFDDPEILEIVFKSHRIIYRVDGKKVFVMRVIHAARDLKRRQIEESD